MVPKRVQEKHPYTQNKNRKNVKNKTKTQGNKESDPGSESPISLGSEPEAWLDSHLLSNSYALKSG